MRCLSALIALLLTACGARSALDAGEALPVDASAPPPPVPPPRACLDDLARTSAPAWERGHACDASSLGDGIGMFAMVGFDLIGMTGKGPRVVHHFFEGEDVAGASPTDAEVATRGDYVAATLTRLPAGVAYGDLIRAETVLLHVDGTLIRKEVEEGPWVSSVGLSGFFLSDRGVIIEGRRFKGDTHTYAARDTGPLAKGPGALPVAEPAPSGLVAVRIEDPPSPTLMLSWMDPCTGELHPTRANDRETPGTFQPWGHRLVYLDDDPTKLVVEAPEGATTIDLGEKGDLIEIHPAGYALLETAEKGRVLLADLNANAVRAVTLEPPPGWSALGVARPASDGRLYMALRDSALGYLEVTSDGSSWTPVGVALGEVAGVTARETNGTFYIFGNINGAISPPWAPAPPGTTRLDYNSVQVAREDGTSVVLKNPPFAASWIDSFFHLAADGGCVFNGNNGGAEITSASSGVVTFVPLNPKIYNPVDASTFVPGGDMLPWY